jgi:CRP-like cAMP-binding protein
LLQKGDICNYTYFVEKGMVRMYAIDAGGKEHILQFAPEGRLITDRRSSLENTPSDFFIQAIEDTTVVCLKKSFMTKIITAYPQTAEQNTNLLYQQLALIQRRVEMLLSSVVVDRYLDFMRMYPKAIQRLPQWMIASYLGVTPESLSRAKHDIATR